MAPSKNRKTYFFVGQKGLAIQIETASNRIEVNPKVWTKNFGVYFMRKKHDHQALLKYMHMLEDGYSIKHIEDNYG
ncbi:MAG: hypothetical protein IJB60_05000, partial [Bacteroidaceae bacterium]|nr:hypothetical protein [Bacteroidaceae bacterium]